MLNFIAHNWQQLLWQIGILAVGVLVALLARFIGFVLLQRLTRRKGAVLGQSLVTHGRRPSLWILPLIAVLLILPGLELPEELQTIFAAIILQWKVLPH